jgi:hypothetical protein
MRLLVTADLHYNHRISKPLADEVIEQMNTAAAGDEKTAVLVVGDTAGSHGDDLELCLSRFGIAGPKLFVAGNHELWTGGDDSYRLFTEELPRRVRNAGWHWLEGDPIVLDGGVGVAGSIGWYDYTFALSFLGIPKRFYEQKISPAAAERFSEFAYLLERTDDISEAGREVAARWNDGRYVHLHRSDEQFLAERLAVLSRDLDLLSARDDVKQIIAAVHHVPFAELMPPKPTAISSRAFAGAFLGSPAMGELLLRYPKISRVFCGHSHLPAQASIGHIQAMNIGSGYRWKTFEIIEI